jgi:rSAM/selenodomain-associated transferase 2
MKFSIIIPTLNEQNGIADCLSALQILRRDAELIVVDGGSDDATLALAKPLADKVLNCEAGRAKQMNYAASYASGEILIFLHADTYLPSDALTLIEQILLSHKVWGRFAVELTGSQYLLKVVAWFMNWRSRLTGIATGDQVLFVKKTAFEAVDGYADITLMEDINLCQKLKAISPPLCLKARVMTSGRRWQKFGLWKTILLMWRLRLGYFFGQNPTKLAQLYRNGIFF